MSPVRLRRRKLPLFVGTAFGIVAVAYATLCGFARRPLSPTEFWIFAAAVLRATPAHLRGSSPLETLRLGGAAFGAPVKVATLSLGGQTYTLPLPPRTGRGENHPRAQRFITFATPEEEWEYLRSTLPQAGWSYRDQFGSVHVLGRGDVILSVQSTFYRGTRIGELRISLHSRRARGS